MHFANLKIPYRQKQLKNHTHCVKRARIMSFSGPYVPEHGLNTNRYGFHSRIGLRKVKTFIATYANRPFFLNSCFLTLGIP